MLTTPIPKLTKMAVESTPCTVLYKVLTTQEFTSLPYPPAPLFKGTAFDLASELRGVHLATSTQLPDTLAVVFPEHTDLWIIALPRTELLEKGLVWDVEGRCARFVGELDMLEQVALRRPIKKVGGEWDFGELLY